MGSEMLSLIKSAKGKSTSLVPSEATSTHDFKDKNSISPALNHNEGTIKFGSRHKIVVRNTMGLEDTIGHRNYNS